MPAVRSSPVAFSTLFSWIIVCFYVYHWFLHHFYLFIFVYIVIGSLLLIVHTHTHIQSTLLYAFVNLDADADILAKLFDISKDTAQWQVAADEKVSINTIIIAKWWCTSLYGTTAIDSNRLSPMNIKMKTLYDIILLCYCHWCFGWRCSCPIKWYGGGGGDVICKTYHFDAKFRMCAIRTVPFSWSFILLISYFQVLRGALLVSLVGGCMSWAWIRASKYLSQKFFASFMLPEPNKRSASEGSLSFRSRFPVYTAKVEGLFVSIYLLS